MENYNKMNLSSENNYKLEKPQEKLRAYDPILDDPIQSSSEEENSQQDSGSE